MTRKDDIRGYALRCAALIQETAMDLGSREAAHIFLSETVQPLLSGMVANLQQLDNVSFDEAGEMIIQQIRKRFVRLEEEVKRYEKNERH